MQEICIDSWLNKKEDNKKLILFFNGWGMNETPVNHLESEDCDILILYDYSDLSFDFAEFDFSKYKEKNLIAWSMGVYVANLFKDVFKDFNKKVAINGTCKMIDNDYGIAKKIYDITIKLFGEKTCEKFIQNMFEDGEIPAKVTITRTMENLKKELEIIKTISFQENLDFDFKSWVIDNDLEEEYKEYRKYI